MVNKGTELSLKMQLFALREGMRAYQNAKDSHLEEAEAAIDESVAQMHLDEAIEDNTEQVKLQDEAARLGIDFLREQPDLFWLN